MLLKVHMLIICKVQLYYHILSLPAFCFDSKGIDIWKSVLDLPVFLSSEAAGDQRLLRPVPLNQVLQRCGLFTQLGHFPRPGWIRQAPRILPATHLQDLVHYRGPLLGILAARQGWQDGLIVGVPGGGPEVV